ncbi:MAG: methionine biosynthesis protein MetW [Gammaproteobacteria bacterium]|nr:methionine biosynthesis protein MetW [Gammaproteobacteria bacterium]
MRPDYAILVDWIPAGSSVLDLGCGDGELLGHLVREKAARGYGMELSMEAIPNCIRNGINVIHSDIDRGLSEFDDNSFDFVVLSLTLQAIAHPHQLLEEMLRVGTQGIVTFPNFGHWRNRLQLAAGRMPVTKTLPWQWFDTPNIHLCTMRDFEVLCRELGMHVLERRAVDRAHRGSLGLRLLPNLLGEIALYRFTRR